MAACLCGKGMQSSPRERRPWNESDLEVGRASRCTGSGSASVVPAGPEGSQPQALWEGTERFTTPAAPGTQIVVCSFSAVKLILVCFDAGFRAVDAVKLAKHELESQNGSDAQGHTCVFRRARLGCLRARILGFVRHWLHWL